MNKTSWIMSKRHICKSKFHVCYHFLDIYENPRKNFISPSWLKHPKIIKWNKKSDKSLFLHFFVVPQKGFIFLRYKKSVKIKSLCRFPPFFLIGTTRVKTVFVELPIYTIFVFLRIEIHKNNVDTSRCIVVVL